MEHNANQSKTTTIDIDVVYFDNKRPIIHELIQEKNELVLYKKSLSLVVENSKVKDSFIETAIKESKGGDYLKIELNSKENSITIDTILDCIEYIINPNYEIIYTKDNMISLFYAFSICKLEKKKNEVLDKIMFDLSDENIILFLQVIPSLKNESLNQYAYSLIKHLHSVNYGLGLEIKHMNQPFKDIIHINNNGKIVFDANRIYYSNKKKNILPNTLYANLMFLQKYLDKNKEKKKFFEINNYFNIGIIYRRKSEFGIMHDYPHYYQLSLENDSNINLYAIRESENSNFIISSDINDFSKYGMNYLGEIEPNFWGTQFDVYDYGFDQVIYNQSCKCLMKERQCVGKISYQTNIMGECPRFFSIETYSGGVTYKLENIKPEWSDTLMCHCLNFYGRVKKASARNFQIICPGEDDNILLMHGKNKKNAFSIDFRDPFCPILAFATSLVALGKKRVVS